MAHSYYYLASFDHPNEAEDALNKLTEEFIPAEDVTLVARDSEEIAKIREDHDTGEDVVTGAGEGAVTGATLGGLAGFLVSAVPLLIPGIGPLIAVGPIAAWLGLTGVAATTVTGATTGAVLGGIIGAFTNLGFSEEEAKGLAEVVKSGGVLMTVPVSNKNINDVRDVLIDANAANYYLLESDQPLSMRDTKSREDIEVRRVSQGDDIDFDIEDSDYRYHRR